MLNHRRFTERYPLRVTIVVVLLTLVATALIASGVLATTTMRGYLIDKVDDQLAQVARSGGRGRFDRPPPGVGSSEENNRPLPSVFVVRVNNVDGTPRRGPDQAQLGEG